MAGAMLGSMDKGTLLRFYKHPEVQQAIIAGAKGREVAVRYGDRGFGKRPDVLAQPADVLELVRQGATSFHVSEERWKNPMRLSSEMKTSEMAALRTGWDLVIDVDFPVWNATKLITHALVAALQEHGIRSVSCKFSGNKGFHIGVPFEAFPAFVNNLPTATLFPEGPGRITEYLTHYIDSPRNNFALSEKIFSPEFEKQIGSQKRHLSDFTQLVCSSCGMERVRASGSSGRNAEEHLCSSCRKQLADEGSFAYCTNAKCDQHLVKHVRHRTGGSAGQRCTSCHQTNFRTKFLLKIDTALISARHMYRSIYSFHEKSGLLSVPVPLKGILAFEKEQAQPSQALRLVFPFFALDKLKRNEAGKLIRQVFDYRPRFAEPAEERRGKKYPLFDAFADLDMEALGPETFPPCIRNILGGIKDGRKRAVFILLNYFTSIGWGYDRIEKMLMEWNEKNPEQLREVNIRGAVRHHKAQKKKMLPPNCAHKAYYLDFNVCTPDAFCQRIKNPAQYSKLKARLMAENRPRRRKLKKEAGTEAAVKAVKDAKEEQEEQEEKLVVGAKT